MKCLNAEIEMLVNQEKDNTTFLPLYSSIDNLEEITDDMIAQLTREVVVYNSETIEVKWNFVETQ